MANNINFDPNYIANLRAAEQKIKLVFGIWQYRYETIVDVKINRYGIPAIDWAIEVLYEQLFGDQEPAILIMKDIEGNELEMWDEDEYEDEYDWLKSMLISAEILSFEGDKSIWK